MKIESGMIMPPVYLDYNATTPLASEVAAAMRPYLEGMFGNPSSSHWYGTQAKQAVAEARRQVALLLGCRPDEIIFTSGGSESNNLAIKGAMSALGSRGDHIITSSIEHPAVMEVCRYLEGTGVRVTYLPVDGEGRVSVEDFIDAMTPDTVLATIMHANNETGTIQPIEELAAAARKKGILFHTDAAQSVGKVPVDTGSLGVDLLSVAGHKFYAPKGVGALFIRRGVTVDKLIHGADHEKNIRAGTENVMEIAGLGKAAEVALRDLKANISHMKETRDALESILLEDFPDMRINGSREHRLPNTLSVSFHLVEANTLLDEISEDVAASAGAACHTDSIDVSTVLEAMGVPVEYAMGTVRFSTGRMTTTEDIDNASKIVSAAVNRLGGRGDGVSLSEAGSEEVKLTRFTHGLGCACKLRPQDLEAVLDQLPAPDDDNVLVGKEKSDDAAVYRISADAAIVQTVDFFTPVVDDPFTFGAIAAANSLSDIYAMGARPLFGLNIVGFPEKRLQLDVLRRILDGAQSKADEAGISIIGGHTIEDPEPKYGLAVTGIVHPDRIVTNSGARPGDALVLTKELGTGIIATAMKMGAADEGAAERAVSVMTGLNRDAAEAMEGFRVSACTDVTGFGLIGHLLEMTRGSGVDAVLHLESIPVIEGVKELAIEGHIPGGTLNNQSYTGPFTDWDEEISMEERAILCDAQTSGGLLISLPEVEAVRLVDLLAGRGIRSSVIGMIADAGDGRIRVSAD